MANGVSNAVAQALLNPRTPDIFGSFEKGAAAQRQQKARELAGQVFGGQEGGALAELAGQDPNMALVLAQASGIPLDQPGRVKRFAQNANTTLALLEANDIRGAENFMIKEKKVLNGMGIPTPRIDEGLQELRQDPEGFRGNMRQLVDAFQGQGIIPLTERQKADLKRQQAVGSQKVFAPVTIQNKQTGEKRLVSPAFDPRTGEARLEPFQMPSGFEVSRETPQEKRAADVLAKGEEEAIKKIESGKAERASVFINEGLSAAATIPTLKRAIGLLEQVETGGVDRASLRIKQLFGIESADEAELSALMGRAVLAQLKPIFGAQFTVREGDKLERIEAGFGKSTEGNKRLLRELLRMAQREANRGLKTSRNIKDQDSADEIQELLAFEFKGDTKDQPGKTLKFDNQGNPIQ